MSGPPCVATMPLGIDGDWWMANAHDTASPPSAALEQPSSRAMRAPPWPSSPGWKKNRTPPGELAAAVGQQAGGAGQHGRVGVVAAGVHGAVDLGGEVEPGVLGHRQGVHVAPQQDRRAGPAAVEVGDDRRLALPVATVSGRPSSASSTRAWVSGRSRPELGPAVQVPAQRDDVVEQRCRPRRAGRRGRRRYRGGGVGDGRPYRHCVRIRTQPGTAAMHRVSDGDRVAPRAQDRARGGAGGLAVLDRGDPVDEDPHDALGAGGEPGRAARQVVDQPGVLGARRSRGRTPPGRRGPRGDRPRSTRPNSSAGSWVISCTARSSEASLRPQAVGQEPGRVGRPAHAVEVGAGVGAAEHDPGSSHTSWRMRHDSSSSSVGMGHSTVRKSSSTTISTSVSNGVLALLGGDVAHDPARQALVGLGVGVADDVAVPAGEPAEHAGLLAVRRARACGPHLGVGERRCFSSSGRRRTSPQPGISHRAQKVRKLMFMGTSTGMVRATTGPPCSAARSAAASWRGTRSGPPSRR